MTRIEEIEEEEDALYADLQESENDPANRNESFDQFEARRKPFMIKFDKLSRERRMLIIPTFEPLEKDHHIMSLEIFIETVKSGGFIDYDGYGEYVKDDQRSGIIIFPSDVAHNAIRKDFDTIVWYNK